MVTIGICKYVGCYAQTDLWPWLQFLGLETNATFDSQTDEFIIHSPNLPASKVSKMDSFYLVVGERFDILIYHLVLLLYLQLRPKKKKRKEREVF